MRTMPAGWRWSDGVGYLPLGDNPVPYDGKYFENYARLATTKRGRIITDLRVNFVERWASRSELLLDVGIGCGAFLLEARSRGWRAYGTDVNPVAIAWLERRLLKLPQHIKPWILTLWDVFEHIPDGGKFLKCYDANWVFMSMPIYRDQEHALTSRHFKPGEHCWYFTLQGLMRFMEECGYECMEMNKLESHKGGRDSIGAFAFRKEKYEEDHRP